MNNVITPWFAVTFGVLVASVSAVFLPRACQQLGRPRQCTATMHAHHKALSCKYTVSDHDVPLGDERSQRSVEDVRCARATLNDESHVVKNGASETSRLPVIKANLRSPWRAMALVKRLYWSRRGNIAWIQSAAFFRGCGVERQMSIKQINADCWASAVCQRKLLVFAPCPRVRSHWVLLGALCLITLGEHHLCRLNGRCDHTTQIQKSAVHCETSFWKCTVFDAVDLLRQLQHPDLQHAK